jgi:hypothetical protein
MFADPGALLALRGYAVARSKEDLMPFKSQAQRRKFAQLLVEGKISNETFEEWNRETGAQRLPERVGRKATSTKKTTAKRAPSRRSPRARKR